MMNPVANIASPPTDDVDFYNVRRNFSKVSFQSQHYFLYNLSGTGSIEDYELEPPETEAFCFWNNKTAQLDVGYVRPAFINPAAWGEETQLGIQQTPSGFITPNNSIMPKLVIPSELLVDNGVFTGDENGAGGQDRGIFNWNVVSVIPPPSIPHPNTYYMRAGGVGTAKYVSLQYKDDNSASSQIIVECSLNQDRWDSNTQYYRDLPVDPTKLVAGGAMVIMMSIIPNNSGQCPTIDFGRNPSPTGNVNWSVNINFPDSADGLKISFDSTGALKVNIAGNDDKGETMPQASNAEKPPAFQAIAGNGGIPYCVVIYPVWNGVVVANGIQDPRNTEEVTSRLFVKKKKENFLGSITPPFVPTDVLPYPNEAMWPPDGSGDPMVDYPPVNPYALNYVTSSPDVQVDFGNQLQIEFVGCKADFAYQPLFFLSEVGMDYFYTTTADGGDVRYWQWAYPIWTDNGVPSFGIKNCKVDPNYNKSGTDYDYRRIRFEASDDARPDNPNYLRTSGEIFGFVLQADENRHISNSNADGVYPLTSIWNGAAPADPYPSSYWSDYIHTINTTISLDSTSGSITLDKYGMAGQRAITKQYVGRIEITASGTHPINPSNNWIDETIFTGLGLGAGDSGSSDGATCNIPLVGRSKKMEDMALINAPFFDGYLLYDVLKYLLDYVGLEFGEDQYHGTMLYEPVMSTDDIQTAHYDFKTGTSVQDALSQVTKEQGHTYFFDAFGKIQVYEMDKTTGLPVTLGDGIEWSNFYTGPVTVVATTFDQTPDFENIRNQIVGFGLQKTETTETEVKNFPVFPLIQIRNITNNYPHFAWAKMMVQGFNAFVNESDLSTLLDKMESASRTVYYNGRTSVVGNPSIWPYDTWTINGLQFVIISVTQNMDFSAKTWTTDVEFAAQSIS